MKTNENTNPVRIQWQKFYEDHFGWTVDLSQIIIPRMPTVGKWRLVLIVKGMTMNKAFEKGKTLFQCFQYSDDLDKSVTVNIRNTSEHYAVWVLDEIEPDHEFLGKSAHKADPDMKTGITLLERIILEIKYFSETGKHLDMRGCSICSGSRYSDGGVPVVGWRAETGGPRLGVRVFWYSCLGRDSNCGVRSAVAL